jgi:ATPase
VTNFEIEILNERKAIVRVPEDEIPLLVGKRGRNIRRIEDTLNVGIDVYPLSAKEKRAVKVDDAEKHWIIHAEGFEGRRVNVYAENEYLFTASVGSKGIIKVRKDKDTGKTIKLALMRGKKGVHLRIV